MSITDARDLANDIKLRLSSPVIFTYMWVFLSYNIDHILYLFFEPLKISTKLELLSNGWSVFNPLWLSALVIVFVPSLNNIAELVKLFWDLILKKLSIYFKLKQFYTVEEYSELEDKHQRLENRYRAIYSDYDDIQKRLDNGEKDGLLAELPKNNSSESQMTNALRGNILSDEEQFFISKISESLSGKVTGKKNREVIGGTEYLVDGNDVFYGIDSVTRRRNAKTAFESLIVKGYLKHESEDLYALTTKGFEYMDLNP